MSLSPEIDSEKRVSFTPAFRQSSPSLTPSRIEDINLRAAFRMAAFSRVKISQEEANLYRDLRLESPDGKPLKSDQVLMAEKILSGERCVKFKKAFPNIFPPCQ